ncbi:hypothetical protein PR048_020785 [Dryococelus australis]|uniref:Uncharacterized protein n=1 Tax=Dryococelus australis TaxID=614101 RepID=A0ABQ9GWD3_9NEOP|nr:hypothetical protein PR048_020785 [Dryococelus australis]
MMPTNMIGKRMWETSFETNDACQYGSRTKVETNFETNDERKFQHGGRVEFRHQESKVNGKWHWLPRLHAVTSQLYGQPAPALRAVVLLCPKELNLSTVDRCTVIEKCLSCNRTLIGWGLNFPYDDERSRPPVAQSAGAPLIWGAGDSGFESRSEKLDQSMYDIERYSLQPNFKNDIIVMMAIGNTSAASLMQLLDFRSNSWCRVLHLNCNLEAKPKGMYGYDKLHKVRPLVKLLNENCSKTYHYSNRPC